MSYVIVAWMTISYAKAFNSELFHLGKAKISTEAAQVLKEASEDFLLVIQGKKPKYAKDTGLEALDGGSKTYAGHGYSLEVKCIMGKADTFDGYWYGPSLKFSSEKIDASHGASHITFYSRNELVKMKVCGQGHP